MTHRLPNLRRLVAELPRVERGALAIEHALIVAAGSSGVAVSFRLAHTIEKGFQTVLAALL